MSTETLAQRDLRANGIWADPAPGPGRHWATRVLRSPWTWVTLGATLIFAACLGWMYWTVTRDVPVRDGVIPGLNFALDNSDVLIGLLIGVILIADGFGMHVPKGYIYFAMAFSAVVEALNLLAKRQKKKYLKQREGDTARETL